MKNKIKSVGLLVVLAFCLTGCVKFNTNMSIHKDKSMDFEMIYALDTSMFGSEEVISTDDEDIKAMEDKGFKVEKYSENSLSGIRLTKNIKNIDKISNTEDSEFSLSGILDTNDEYLFKVKKGLFKNIYTAKLKFDSSDSSLDNGSSDLDDDYDSDTDMDFGDSFDYSSLMNNLDLSVSVSLPYKAISSNATSTANNDKDLTWKLNAQNVQYIEFEFALYNMTTIFGGIGIIVLLFVFIIVALIFLNKNNKNENSNIPPVVLNNDVNLNNEVINPVNVEPKSNSEVVEPQELQSIHLGEAPEVKAEPIIPTPVMNTEVLEEVKESSPVENTFNVEDVFNVSSIPQDGLMQNDNNNNNNNI